MTFRPGHASNLGKTTTVEPITSLADVAKVRALIERDVRLRALWAVAINSALRASDLVALRWDDTTDDGECITLVCQERKTSKRRVVTLNAATSTLLRAWRAECFYPTIFCGQRGPLTVGSWSRIVKDLCAQAGLKGRFASHTTRKSWVRLQLDEYGTSLQTLMVALNHSTERQTLAYCGRTAADVASAYRNVL